MATTASILARIYPWNDPDPWTHYVTERIDTFTPPSIAPPPIFFFLTAAEEACKLGHRYINQSQVFCFKHSPKETTWQSFLRPTIQPTCPKQFDPEAWSKHFMFGDDKYHIITPQECYPKIQGSIILKVAHDKEGKCYYENIDPKSLEDERGLDTFVEHYLDALSDLCRREDLKWGSGEKEAGLY